MRPTIAGIRLFSGLAAVAVTAVAVTLTGCGSAGSGAAAPAGTPAAGSTPGDSLALSHMKVLTKLNQAQLCGVLSAAQARRILGAKAARPVYAKVNKLGISCQWLKKEGGALTASSLYVGISSVVNWTGAQALDHRLLRTTPARIDGHPALAAGVQGKVSWAQVDVALGGAHDPVAEYRAPTAAEALALARAATPHILALG